MELAIRTIQTMLFSFREMPILRKAGKLIVYTPWVELYHYESVSRGRDESGSARTRYFGEKALMMSKWADVFSKPDPYFNPNLRQTIPDACYYRF